MKEVGSDFGQRVKHKGTFMQMGMRQGEFGPRHLQVAPQQEVDVYRPIGIFPAHTLLSASQLALDFLCDCEHAEGISLVGLRTRCHTKGRGSIEKGMGRIETHRGGFVHTGDGHARAYAVLHLTDGAPQGGFAFANIGSQGYIQKGHFQGLACKRFQPLRCVSL